MSGCALTHSEYNRPELAEYSFKEGSTSFHNLNKDFWEIFNDPKLNYLVEVALSVNVDYIQAVINAQKALKEADITATNLIPDLGGSIGSGLRKNLTSGTSSKNSNSALNVSYEIDLFGRLAANRKASNYEASASIYDAETARFTVAATVTQLYWDIVYYKDIVKLSNANLEDAIVSYKIMKNRFDVGDVSRLELVQSERDTVDMETTKINDEIKLKQKISALNVLLNRVPDAEIDTIDSLREAFVPEVDLGIGSDVLLNRPDVRAAEEKLKASVANIDVAKLDMFPKLTLSGEISAGSASEFYKFFTNPVAGISGLLSFPFLNYYQNSLKIDVAKLSKDSAEIGFVNTYYKALAEIYQSNEDVSLYKARLVNNKERFDLSLEAEELYKNQYEAGKVALKDYLDAKSLRRSSQNTLISDKKDLLNSIVTLSKAVGGNKTTTTAE